MFVRKMGLVLATSAFSVSAASAQDVTISLPGQDWQTISALLQEAPYRVAAPVLEKLNRQFMMLQQQQQQQQQGRQMPMPPQASAQAPTPSAQAPSAQAPSAQAPSAQAPSAELAKPSKAP